MITYNIVKKCRRCGARMVLPKEFSKKNFCDECQKKVDEEKRREEENKEEKE